MTERGQAGTTLQEKGEEKERRGTGPWEVGEGAASLSETDCVRWLPASEGLDSLAQEVPRSRGKGRWLQKSRALM